MDREEFARRTEAVKGRLYRAAYVYLGSEADALEAVDEAIFKALQSLKQLRQEAYFESWLTRILINTCRKELRRRKWFSPGGEEALPESAGPDAYDHLPLPDYHESEVWLRPTYSHTAAEETPITIPIK